MRQLLIIVFSFSMLNAFFVFAENLSNEILEFKVSPVGQDLGLLEKRKELLKTIDDEIDQAQQDIVILNDRTKKIIDAFNFLKSDLNSDRARAIEGSLMTSCLVFLKTCSYNKFYPQAIKKYCWLLQRLKCYKKYLCRYDFNRAILKEFDWLIYHIEQYADRWKFHYIAKAEEYVLLYTIKFLDNACGQFKDAQSFNEYKNRLCQRLKSKRNIIQYDLRDLKHLRQQIKTREKLLRKAINVWRTM